MDKTSVRDRVIEAADELFYGRGIGNVGVDAVRDAAGVSLRALYKEFPAKEDIVLAVLGLRHDMWTTGVRREVDGMTDPAARMLAVYDYLAVWFEEADFRGCGFINAFGELGSSSRRVAEAVREHKQSFQRYVEEIVAAGGGSRELAAQLAILAEGAQTTAAIAGTSDAAGVARSAAETLIGAAGLAG
ncbi:TetR/AcrR family transcriptional regulator [Microbacterium indicum]|uniref:TetR/AcrR family transcriptional regulator n=1 Tax=Microbacterium indicum TaxID=358100 RepID=UPI0004267D64|nr:TetR/AcrR family transcriptional regulator [Microbacterium indicum]